MFNYSAYIDKGPTDWQIIQQNRHSADIELMGRFVMPDNNLKFDVQARVVSEDSGFVVANWINAVRVHDEKSWSVTIKKIPAGGLYRIETRLFIDDGNQMIIKRGDMIHHIGVGDIYVIAGQSNATGYGKEPVLDPPEPGIHMLRGSGLWDMATHPLADSTRTVNDDAAQKGNSGHSPFIHFARILRRELKIPIGLVPCSKGGSAILDWIPVPQSVLYNNMIDMIKRAGGNIKGVLWYQGCSEACGCRSENYLDYFTSIVKALRNDLKNSMLPFLTVQLNKRQGKLTDEADKHWSTVTEAQRTAAHLIKNVYVIPSMDLSLSDGIHNSSISNMVIGERLARLTLYNLYNVGAKFLPPDIGHIKKTGKNKVELKFENVSGGFDFLSDKVEHLPFMVEDIDGVNNISSYEASGDNKIILMLERDIKSDLKVHCAYGRNPGKISPVDSNTFLPILAFYNKTEGDHK